MRISCPPQKYRTSLFSEVFGFHCGPGMSGDCQPGEPDQILKSCSVYFDSSPRASSVSSPRAILAAENLVLRHQLGILRRSVKRPRTTGMDRWVLSALAVRSRRILDAIIIVKPETILRWHRAGARLLWRQKSRGSPGRPPIDAELRSLIRRMWSENLTWGADRIAAELAKLGYRVAARTVAKYRPKGLDRSRGQRWSTFIKNHLHETWASDLFTVWTATFQIVYVYVVLSLDRRTIVKINATKHPTAQWLAQNVLEATWDHRTPRFLIHDRDSSYGAEFQRRVDGLGIERLVIPPRMAVANAFLERMIGTLRRDCFDHVIVFNEKHASRVARKYVDYYHGRPHRSLHLQPPIGERWLAPPRARPGTRIASRPVLFGLHHIYGFAA